VGSDGRPARPAGAAPRPADAGRGRIARKGNLADGVRSAIEQKILEGAIGAGQKLNASALAAELQVSRAPVREALRALEEAGLVRAVPNQGVFVREVALQEALDAEPHAVDPADLRVPLRLADHAGQRRVDDRRRPARLPDDQVALHVASDGVRAPPRRGAPAKE